MSQVSAPVSTIVIASDIAGATAFGANVLQAFDQVLAVARALGFLTQDPGRPNLTLTLSPDQDGGGPLGALAKAAADFDAQVQPLRLRTMVHYGVVFRTETASGVSYLGSAIRSAQSALRRAPAAGGMLATADFASYAAKLPSLPFRVQAVTGAAAVDGLSELVFGAAAGTAGAGATHAAPGAVDAALVDFLKRRLADEIGPFANALVDRAAGGGASAEQVLAALGQHVDNAVARKKFEDDVQRFVKSRA